MGSLGTIPGKYDIAVSTACGALNNMVVDTVTQGQACIEFLHKQNIGRASFMVLEKLPTDKLNERVVTPEGVPQLFNLIKPKDPHFAPAFLKAVGNTLAAENLDQANRIAFGGSRRWHVVTLAGQLIDSSRRCAISKSDHGGFSPPPYQPRPSTLQPSSLSHAHARSPQAHMHGHKDPFSGRDPRVSGDLRGHVHQPPVHIVVPASASQTV